jgi:hypothetical protein
MEWVDDTFSPIFDVMISQMVPTPRAQHIPYAYTSGCLWNAVMDAIPPAMVLVLTRPSNRAPANSKMAAICETQRFLSLLEPVRLSKLRAGLHRAFNEYQTL